MRGFAPAPAGGKGNAPALSCRKRKTRSECRAAMFQQRRISSLNNKTSLSRSELAARTAGKAFFEHFMREMLLGGLLRNLKLLALQWENRFQVRMGTRNYMHGYKLSANALDSRGSGICSGLACGHIAAHHGGYIAAADLLVCDKAHASGLDHSVRSFNKPYQSSGFNQSESIHLENSFLGLRF
jgi:hypothetical protein